MGKKGTLMCMFFTLIKPGRTIIIPPFMGFIANFKKSNTFTSQERFC